MPKEGIAREKTAAFCRSGKNGKARSDMRRRGKAANRSVLYFGKAAARSTENPDNMRKRRERTAKER